SPEGRRVGSGRGEGEANSGPGAGRDEKQEARLTLRARVPGPSVNVAFSPDSRRLATGGEGNTVKIWDVEKGGEPLATLRGHSKEGYAVAFSPNDKRPWVASGGEGIRGNILNSGPER